MTLEGKSWSIGRVIAGCVLLSSCSVIPKIPFLDRLHVDSETTENLGVTSEEAREKSLPVQYKMSPAMSEFLLVAATLESTLIPDPISGQTIRVVAGKKYYSASGRLCRRFEVNSASSSSHLRSGVGCEDQAGNWTLSRIFVNTDLENYREE